MALRAFEACATHRCDLTDVLDRIDGVVDDDLRDLLPGRWKPPSMPAAPVDFDVE
ncbi:MAG: hypothetical protein ACHREM_11725 [Polyangiales bacterium]